MGECKRELFSDIICSRGTRGCKETHMEEWQARVVVEKAELDEKISKLMAFIKGPKMLELSEMQQELLRDQVHYMGMYSEVLRQRIVAFGQ